jgi:hypothetical protein
MIFLARMLVAGIAGAALLAGCSSEKQPAEKAQESDPALSGALDEQIMVDPALAGQDGAVVAGPNKVELPPEQRSPAAIAAAMAEASKLAGGAIQPAPAALGGKVSSLVEGAATAAQVAEAARTGKVDCSGKVEYSMNWVNSLPKPLAVYPRGAVQEAAGTDRDGCSLRVVSFATPVPAADVIDFYATRVRAAGYSVEHQMDDADHVLGGKKGVAAYLVYARKLENGLTEVDIVASGK